jgi:hypothetical protein
MKHGKNVCVETTWIIKARNVQNMIQRKLDTKNMISHKRMKHDNYVYETWIL